MAKKRTLKVNMEGVEAGLTAIPEGDYTVKVVKVEEKEGESSGKPYLKFELEVTAGEHKGAKLYHTCSLQPQALFNLKSTLIALGESVPNKAMNLDLDALEGLEMGVAVGHEVYEGKKRAKVVEVFPVDEGDEDEEPDYTEMDLDELKALCKEREIEVPKKKVTEAKLIALLEAWDEENAEDEEGEEGEDDEPDYSEMDLDELKALCKEREIEIPKKKVTEAKLIALLEAWDEENGEDEEGDEDEEPNFDEMDTDELLAWAKENDVSVAAKYKKSETRLRKFIKTKYEEMDV